MSSFGINSYERVGILVYHIYLGITSHKRAKLNIADSLVQLVGLISLPENQATSIHMDFVGRFSLVTILTIKTYTGYIKKDRVSHCVVWRR